MKTTPTQPLHGLLVAVLACAPLVPAQNKKPPQPDDRLGRLLEQLRKLPPAAWQSKLDKLRARIADHVRRAAVLRKQAAALEAEAKVLTAEIEQLESLRKLIKPAKAAPQKKTKTQNTKTTKTMDKPRLARIDFERHVFPILEEHCVVCHESGDASGGLDLSTFESLARGGGSGSTLVPGQPDGSRLYRLIARKEKPYMPKDADPLEAPEVELIRRWIAAGAPKNARAAIAARKRTTPRAPTAPRFFGPVPVPRAWPAVAVTTAAAAAPIKAIDVSPRGALVAVAGLRQVLVYEGAKLVPRGVLPFRFGEVEVLRFSADGRELLVAGGLPGKSGGAILYDVVTGKELGRYGRERDTVLAAALSPGGTLVAIGGPAKRVRVFARQGGAELYRVDGHRDWVLAIDFSPDGNYLASGDRAGDILVREADTGRDVHRLRGHKGAVTALRFRPDAGVLATGGQDGTVRAFEMRRGRQLASRAVHRGAVLAMAWSRKNTLVTTGEDGRAKLWRANGQPGGDLPSLREWLYAAGVSPDGSLVFTGDGLGRLQVFEAIKRARLRVITPTRRRPHGD